jgi:phage terminase large subunit-like protein
MPSCGVSVSPEYNPFRVAAHNLKTGDRDPRIAWKNKARAEQLPPAGQWRNWLITGGRGSGKTRTGSSTLMSWILDDPEPGDWGIVAPTYRDAWTTCVEGEALALDTYVPTPSGAAVMGDLRAGDEVIGGDGTPCRVTEAFDVLTGRECYRVTFKGGAHVIADADHKWLVEPYLDRAFNRRYGGNRQPVVMTTAQMLPEVRYRHMRGATRNYGVRIPKTTYGDWPVSLPLDPYCLGYWLGDGTSKSGAITTADPEVLDHYRAAGFAVTEQVCDNGAARTYGILGLFRPLRLAGLIRNKHVPVRYLRAAAADRLALVQGLMDSDGCATERGQCEFVNKNRLLADALVELLCSLGVKASAPRSKISSVGTTHWLVKFTTTEPVFRIARKLDRLPAKYRDADHWLIESIEPVPSVPVRCISVSSPDRTYLVTRHHIPTHNSGILTAFGTTMGEVKENKSRYIKHAWRSHGEVILHNGHIIRIDSANDGALRVQGKNLKGAWCIAGDVGILTLGVIKPIRDIRPGDQVLTRQGYRRVLEAVRTGRSLPVVEVTASDGSTLRCTKEHKIWTENRGWVRARHLTAGDLLCRGRQHGSTSAAEGSTGCPPATTPRGTTSSPDASIWLSGKTSTPGPSQLATSSITLTMTRRTMIRGTSPSCPTVITTAITGLDSSARARPVPGFRPESPTHGRVGSPAPSCASGAGRSSRAFPPARRSATAPGSAASSGSSSPGESRSSPGPSARATSAGSRSCPRTAEATSAPAYALATASVVSVKPHGNSDVYDLTVEGEPEFFAGGILVHNCDELGLWQKWGTAWDESVQFAVRQGISRVVATGTPKVSRPAAALIRRLLRTDSGVVATRMRTMDNLANLSQSFYDQIVSRSSGTRLEQQELEGLLLEDIEGALWTRDLLEASIVDEIPRSGTAPGRLMQAYVGVDPSDGTQSSDEQALAVVGKGHDGKVYVVESYGEKISPVPFMKKAVQAALRWDARIVIEKNHGGAWLIEVLRQVMKEMGVSVPYMIVSAGVAKRTRAEPVAALYERGVVRHVHKRSKDDEGHLVTDDSMTELEDQMATFTGATGERSPDRLDALVWAVTPFLNHQFETSAIKGGVRRWDVQVALDQQERAMRQWATHGERVTRRGMQYEGEPEADGVHDPSLLPQMRGDRPNVRQWRT